MKKLFAFTLIELLLVIAIILILGGMTSSFLARFLTQNNVYNVVDQLAGQMRKAQIYAMMGKRDGAWGVKIDSGRIVLFQGNTFAGRNAAFDENFNINSNITINGLTEVVFNKITGLPSTTSTITISGNSSTATLVINSQGITSK